MTVTELHRRLVAFPSLSHQEKPVADFVEAHVRAAGLPVERLDDNVWFRLGEGENRLLLNSHLDVVPPSAEHPYAPFEPTEVNGNVYGRGAVDAKASVAAMMQAVLELAAEGFAPAGGQVLVALTACEETGGGYNGLEALRPHLPPLAAALVGEPTNLRPCVAQKGLLILNLHAHGRTAHAARAHLGDNAILRTGRDLARLAAFTFDREDPFLGRPTITPTVIQGGSAKNVVPDRCTVTLDIRSTPAYTHEELVALLSGVLESEVQIHSARFVPVATPASEPIVQAAVGATGAEPFGSPTASDWIFLADVPTVKMGPGASELSHTPQEHVPVAELVRGVQVYKETIRLFFKANSQ